jgi:uncharacterized protein YecE (DUF72 family)
MCADTGQAGVITATIRNPRSRNGRAADFVYVRGHGPSGRYHGHYTKPTLAQWARRIKSWKRQGCDVYVYFDNDQKSAAPADAQALKQLLNVRQSAAITTASRRAGAVVHR